MNRDETVALFEACEAKRAAVLGAGKSEDEAHEAAKAHWNAWAAALLAERKALQEAGRWAAKKQPWGDLEPKNEETRAWMKQAAADLSSCLFLVRGADGTSKETAGQEKKETKDADPPVKSIQLEGDSADFAGFVFPGYAGFWSATFSGHADFRSATFSGGANFRSTTFIGNADFESATFSGGAGFRSVTFGGYAGFESAAFSGSADFHSVTFGGNADFQSVNFTGDSGFENATFTGYAYFSGAAFAGSARFVSATFTGDAWFESAIITGNAWFDSTTFTGDARFAGTTFKGDASFEGANFADAARFASTTFSGGAWFDSATFEGNSFFAWAGFAKIASFYSIRGERGFDMAGTSFEAVPDFIQAHFEEAPRLDNLEVTGRTIPRHPRPERHEPGSRLRRVWQAVRFVGARVRTWPKRAMKGARHSIPSGMKANGEARNIPARWRALKRLAIQGHDTDRELEFHAREMRSQRFAGDWPLPLAIWSRHAWGGFFRFWFGILYEFFSNFGRSLARPLIFWLAAAALGAVVYMSQSPEIVAARHRQEAKGASLVSAAASRAWHAWLSKPVPCYAGQPAPPKDQNGDTPVYVSALSPALQNGTDLANEAWHLAFRNAFIVLDGSAETAHRSYGCLYGVELYGGGNPLAVVPGAVSTASAIQKLFSALMIFLFGLALRNMLKMK
jgi:hypothetical protein